MKRFLEIGYMKKFALRDDFSFELFNSHKLLKNEFKFLDD